MPTEKTHEQILSEYRDQAASAAGIALLAALACIVTSIFFALFVSNPVEPSYWPGVLAFIMAFMGVLAARAAKRAVRNILHYFETLLAPLPKAE
jgi:riboflavin transporter FmnP